MAALAFADRADILRSLAEMLHRYARSAEEALAGQCQGNAAAMPLEQRRAELVFKIPDTTADRGFFYGLRDAGLAEADVLGGSKETAELAKLDRGERLHPPHLTRRSCQQVPAIRSE